MRMRGPARTTSRTMPVNPSPSIIGDSGSFSASIAISWPLTSRSRSLRIAPPATSAGRCAMILAGALRNYPISWSTGRSNSAPLGYVLPTLRSAERTAQAAAGVIRFARQLTLVTYSRTGRREAFVGGWLRLALVWYRRGSIVSTSLWFTLRVVVGVAESPARCWPNSIV